MDDIKFKCRNCAQPLAIEVDEAGLEICCPRCGAKQIVPAPVPIQSPDNENTAKTAPASTSTAIISREPEGEYKYWAFISYSSKDKSWGSWLHRAIETYGIPAELVEHHQTPVGYPTPKRFHPLFRDRDELPASSNLGAEIQKALEASRYLIVICSPNAAQSQWVNKEIETFLALGRRDHILAIIVDGEPNSGDARECFPPALREFEPIAADARPEGDGKTNAKLKLLAGMLGVSFDSLKQRDAHRRIRYLQKVLALSMLVALILAGLAGYAYYQSCEAVKARKQADYQRSEAVKARKQADYQRDEAVNARKQADYQRDEAVKARKAAEHNLAYVQLAQAGMFMDGRRIMEANSLYISCLDKLQKLGEPVFPVTVGLTELYALSPPALLTFRGHTGGVAGVAFSPNGELALSTSGDNNAKLWEIKTGREMRSFKGHLGSVAFSPDGQWALSRSSLNTAKLWEISTGKEVRTFTGHQRCVETVAFTPDGKWAVAGEMGRSTNSISVWDIATGSLVRKFGWQENRSEMWRIAVSTDGKYVLSAANQAESVTDNSVILWDLATGKDIRHFKGYNAFCAALSPNGQYAVSGGMDKKLILWDIATGEETRTFVGHKNPVHGVTFSPDGKRLLSSGQEQSVRLWDVATGQEIRTFVGHSSEALGVAYSPDGRWALSGSVDQTLRLWEIEPLQEIRAFVGHTAGIGRVTFSSDGRFALSSSTDGAVRTWDIATGLEIQKFTGGAACADLSSDGKLVLTVRYRNLKLWNMETGEEIRSIPGMFFQAAISPNGKWALSSCYTPVGALTLWDLTTGEKIRELTNGSKLSTTGIAFLPDGNRAISSSDDSTLTLWDLSTGQVIRRFRGETYRSSCVAVSKDGAYALSGGWNCKLRLWEIATGREIRTFQGHEGHVSSVAFSPDGRWALSRSEDNTARLWDVQSGEEIRTLSWKGERPEAIAFSPDGKSVLIGNSNGVLRHWDFTRPEQYQNYAHLMEEAQSRLTKDENDADALKTLGEYYAFRGVNDWAVEILERARKGGAQVSSLTLARCYWLLSKDKNIGRPDRVRHRNTALAEFRKEIDRVKDQPVCKEPEAKRAREQEEFYLNLCQQAVLTAVPEYYEN